MDQNDATSVQQPPSDTQSVSPQPSTEQSAQNNYAHNVGESLVDLLTDISLSDARKQKLADAMRLSVSDLTAILEGLLNKIDSEQITEAELALIMTSPITDEVSDAKQSA